MEIRTKLNKFLNIFNQIVHKIKTWLGRNRHFIFNVIIGIVIAILSHFLQPTKFGESVLNIFFDVAIQGDIDSNPDIESEIIFVDIDQETYKQWDLPYFTPLDSISEIVSFTAKHGANMVFIDIDLDYRKKFYLKEQSRKLSKTIGDILNEYSNTKILISAVPNTSDSIMQKTIVDSLIDCEKNLHKVIPLISKSGLDRVVRYMRYYQIAKNDLGHFDLYWTPTFLAAAFKRNLNPEYIDSLKEQILLDMIKNQDQHNHYKIKLPNGSDFILSNSDVFTNRIKFHYRYTEESKFNANLLLTERLSFGRVYKNPDLFEDKIVIIGVSSPDLGEDIHPTPIGEMPGMYIIGNSINVLLRNNQIVPISNFIVYSIELFFILIAAYLFLRLQPLIAMLIAILFIAAVFFIIAPLVYSNFGVYIDTIFPILGMNLHKSVSLIEETFQKGRITR